MDRTGEVVRYFLRLGVVGFGGPAAHIAAMHEDLVHRRRWLDEPRFLEVVGVTNLIPGPNSTEVAIHLGYLRAGPFGGAAAGVAFILPAFLLMLGLSWVYFGAGRLPLREDVLAGIQPVALAAVQAGVWRLRAGVLGGWRRPLLGVVGFGLTLAVPAVSPWVILGGGLAALVATRVAGRLVGAVPLVAAAASVALGSVAWVFLRTGLLLFGGGLVLVPLLAPEVVSRGWLTEAQFLDGIALGQATPGPIVITSTFVGYAVRGWTGAVVATVLVFLPSFAVVLAGTGPFLRRFRERPAVAAFVEGVTATALGAVLAAGVALAPSALDGVVLAAIFVLALVAILARVPVVWAVAGGALLGMGAGVLGLT